MDKHSISQAIVSLGQALEKDLLVLVIAFSALVGLLIFTFLAIREFFLWFFKTRRLVKEVQKLQHEVSLLRKEFSKRANEPKPNEPVKEFVISEKPSPTNFPIQPQ